MNPVRFYVARLALIIITSTTCIMQAGAQQTAKRSPNIIFIIADDQGYGDLGFLYQNQRAKSGDASKPVERSPHIDKLAGEGVVLSQYYCAAPICAPSRASLLLGVSQGHANVRDNQFDKALEDNYNMANTMRTLGYSTAAIGKWGLQGNDKYDINGYQWPAHPLKRGFDYFFGYMRHSDGHEHYPKEALYRKYWAENGKEVWQNYTNITAQLDHCYTADLWTAMAKKYIAGHTRGKEKNKPFLLYLAFDTPHAVQELPAAGYPAGGGLHGGMQWTGKPGRFINTASGTPDTYMYPEYANATYDHDSNSATPNIPWPDTYKRYATANRRIDDAVGDIVQLLKDLKIDSNTVVIYTSDNGPSKESYLPEDKFPPNQPTFFSGYGPFEGIKADTWEGGVRLPAIAWWPGHIASGKKVDVPVIAYDWAPTFIDIAGHAAPQRMDGISLLPALTGKGKQLNPLVYIEYKGEGATPDYAAFSAPRRGRIRNETQLLRFGNYVGVRYDIKTAADDFEIYDVINDPAQHHNLAQEKDSLQVYFKARALQSHHASVGSPRPYDSALIPAVTNNNLAPGIEWKIFKNTYHWIPQVHTLRSDAHGHSGVPSIDTAATMKNVLMAFTGFISVPRDGRYSFYMACDAKAFLRIHDIQVIDEDYGYPGNLLRSDSLYLKAGMHPITLLYYRNEDKGPPFLKLDWSGPGVARQRIPHAVFFREKNTGNSTASATYYIDSRKGSDANSGTDKKSPWKSLARLQEVHLNPGDSIRFKRGSSFTGPLVIRQSGSPDKYITLTDYGEATDPAPAFTNPVFTIGNYGNCIRVEGSYVIVERLYCSKTAAYAPIEYPGTGWPVWEMGAIHIDSAAEHCIVRNNEMFDCVAGIRSNGRHAIIERNYIHDCNRILKEFTWGPLGIWLGADYQEVRYNKIINISAVDPRINWGPNTYGSGADGGAFEIDDARFDKSNIAIHHNYTRDCQGFLEVTWTDVKQNPAYRNFSVHHNVSDDYQQFVAMWRGEGCHIENNTIIRRKKNANDWGVFNITQRDAKNYIRNNIVVTEKDIVIFNVGRKGTAQPNTIISDNLFFAAAGALNMGKEGPGGGAIFENPGFKNYARAAAPEDFAITPKSPAVDKGSHLGYKTDFLNTPIPQDGMPDIGAFECKNEIASAAIPLARDGKALVAIAWPPDASALQRFAATELSYYLQKISGAGFHTSVSSSKPLIQLERSTQLQQEAYTISRRGQNLVLSAGSDRALLFAVYDLLHRLGCRWLAPQFDWYKGQAEFVPVRSVLTYEAANVAYEQPRFAFRKLDIEEGRSHTIENLKQLIDWMPKVRLNTFMVPLDYQGNGHVQWEKWREALTPELKKRDLLIEVGGHGYQNFLNAKMEGGALFRQHPDWFGQNKTGAPDPADHLVFNTSNTQAVNYFAGNVLSYLRQHPEIDIFDCWPPDVARWAESPKLVALGTPADRQAELINRLDSAIHVVKPGLQLEVIAYGQVLQPPQKIKLNKDILVDICPINQSFESPIYDKSFATNKEYTEAINNWRQLFPGAIGLYSYYRKYAWRSLPVQIAHYMQQEMQWYAQLPLQGISTYAEPGDWYTYELNHYTWAALAWDPECRIDPIMNEYAGIRYGRAKQTALAAYASLENIVRHYGGIPYTTLKSTEQLEAAQAELMDQAKKIQAVRSFEKDAAVAANLNRLSLMLNYAIKDLAVVKSMVAGAAENEVYNRVEEMTGFLEQHPGEGVFVIGGKNNTERFVKYYNRLK